MENEEFNSIILVQYKETVIEIKNSNRSLACTSTRKAIQSEYHGHRKYCNINNSQTDGPSFFPLRI
jgi:hypothetical protein